MDSQLSVRQAVHLPSGGVKLSDPLLQCPSGTSGLAVYEHAETLFKILLYSLKQ